MVRLMLGVPKLASKNTASVKLTATDTTSPEFNKLF